MVGEVPAAPFAGVGRRKLHVVAPDARDMSVCGLRVWQVAELPEVPGDSLCRTCARLVR